MTASFDAFTRIAYVSPLQDTHADGGGGGVSSNVTNQPTVSFWHRSTTTQDFFGVMSGSVFGIITLLYTDKGVSVLSAGFQ